MTAQVILLTSLGGGAYVASSARQASFTQTLDMKPQSTLNLSSIRYEIYDYPPGMTLPSGWSQDPSTGAYYFAPSNVTTQPPTVTLPASGANNWGKLMLRLRGNNNPLQFNTDRSPNTFFNPQLTDETSEIWLASPNAGMEGVGFNESTQHDLMRGYVGPLMACLRSLDALGGGSSGVSVGGAVTPSTLTWGASATPLWTQTAPASGAGANWTWAPQVATGTGASGSALVNVGAPASGTTEAGLVIERNGTPIAFIGSPNGVGGSLQISLGYGTGANTGSYLQGVGSTATLNGSGTTQLSVGGAVYVFLNNNIVGFNKPVAGETSGVPFALGSTPVTFGATGSTALTSAQQQFPQIVLSTVTLSGAATLDFGNVTGNYWVDVSGITLGGQTLTFKNGTGTQVVSTMMINGKVLITVSCSANHIAAG